MLWGLCCVFFFMLMLVCVWLGCVFLGLFCIVDGCGSVFVFVFLV